MLNRRFGALLLALLPVPAHAQPSAQPGDPVARFDGHRIVRIDVRGPADLAAMETIGAEAWACEPRLGPCEFRVPPASMAALRASGRDFTIVVPDLQRRVDAENARLRGAGGGVAGAGWFDDYKTLTQIQAYIAELAALHPDIATPITLGQSLQGRPIFGIRIANDAFDTGHCKPAMLLNSCQHAREWISPMVTVYAADQLVRQYGLDPTVTEVVNSTEIIIVPVVNPDGYDYTWSVNRFWRKNRRDNGNGTFGIDLNRNWSFAWGLDVGSSGDPGSDTYRGPAPFSEPETQVLGAYAATLPNLRWHNDIHSHGQLILQPWGWTNDLPPDHGSLDAIGAESQALIKAVHNRTYVHGTTWTKLYPISGGASDWFYGDKGVWSFLYELRGPGFDPPPDQILPCAEEVLPALLGHAQWIEAEFPFLADWNRDCVYDLFDFLAFVNDFGAADPGADYNGDGVLDLFDFLAFVNDFDAGK